MLLEFQQFERDELLIKHAAAMLRLSSDKGNEKRKSFNDDDDDSEYENGTSKVKKARSNNMEPEEWSLDLENQILLEKKISQQEAYCLEIPEDYLNWLNQSEVEVEEEEEYESRPLVRTPRTKEEELEIAEYVTPKTPMKNKK